MWQVWLVASAILLVAEIFTKGFLIFWFSLGALIAMISSIFIDNIIIQCVIFLVSSTLLTMFTKTLESKLRKEENVEETFNKKNMIGKQGIVIKALDGINYGVVKVEGSTWTAYTNGEEIKEGTKIIVEETDGIKLLVKSKK